jgi:mono/diheme cytochrome c family protein
MRALAGVTVALGALVIVTPRCTSGGNDPPAFAVPKTWDQKAVDSLQLPLADPRATPTHVRADYYYKIPARPFVKTFPVYHPDHEPKVDGKNYLDWLKSQKPEPILTDFSALKTEADLKTKGPALGKEVFEAVLGDDRHPPYSFATVADVRNPEWYKKTALPYDDRGIVPTLRYVVAADGSIHVGTFSCAMCHTRVEQLASGRKIVIAGAQGNLPLDRIFAVGREASPKGAQFNDTFLPRFLYGAPWLDPDPAGLYLKGSFAERTAMKAAIPPGGMARHGTSILSPVQIPDLIGLKGRRYFDRTGLVRHRDVGDLMRYSALNQGADYLNHYGKFVPASALPGAPKLEKWPPEPTQLAFSPVVRYTDEQLYALALYLYSLEPPENPYAPKTDAERELTTRGRKVFADSGCAKCHDPEQGYTNNKLVRAAGFKVPDDHPEKANVLAQSVGTDPVLATQTRRGTGLYKVPSLKGVWYRGPFERNGSVATLEDWFDPKRLNDGYVPTGWKGPGDVKARAVKGHEFGLDLSAEDRKALIAFLRTL